MKNRYRLISRGSRGGAFYCVDGSTGKRTSLGACSRDEAEQTVLAKNQALRQPALNLQIARAYLGGSDEGVATRTWQHVMDEVPKLKEGETRARWLTAMKDKAFDTFRQLCLLETKSDHILGVLAVGTILTNVFLRRIPNFALDMNWLPWRSFRKSAGLRSSLSRSGPSPKPSTKRSSFASPTRNGNRFTNWRGTWGARNLTLHFSTLNTASENVSKILVPG